MGYSPWHAFHRSQHIPVANTRLATRRSAALDACRSDVTAYMAARPAYPFGEGYERHAEWRHAHEAWVAGLEALVRRQKLLECRARMAIPA